MAEDVSVSPDLCVDKFENFFSRGTRSEWHYLILGLTDQAENGFPAACSIQKLPRITGGSVVTGDNI